MEITSTGKFRIIRKPLMVGYDLQVVYDTSEGDGVDDMQSYDVFSGGYYPDYTLFPLILQPSVYVSDPDGELGQGITYVTNDITNLSWYVTENGVTQLITTGTNYEVTTSGTNKGRLKVKRNINPQQPITLTFEAQYLDPRTGEIHHIKMSHLLKCYVTQKPCELKTDCPSLITYNPLGTQTHQIIKAEIFSGKTIVGPTLGKCVWEILSNDGQNWLAPQADDTVKFASVSSDGRSIDVNMEFMGKTCVIRCHGIVSDDPTRLAGMTKANAFAYLEFKMRRRVPPFKPVIQSMPIEIGRGLRSINPKGVIMFNNYTAANPEKEIATKWETWQQNGANQVSKTTIGGGLTPTIVTNIANNNQLQGVGFTAADRGEWVMLKDGAGNVLTDGNGDILMVRAN